jgi:Putative beta-barrel porin-2, OmpL-like. bbp2
MAAYRRRLAAVPALLAATLFATATELWARQPMRELDLESTAGSVPTANGSGDGPAVPDRLLAIPALDRRGFSTFGWIEAGIGGNSWGSPFNGPVVMADRNWQGQVNQMYLATERRTDTDGSGWDWGGRVDLLMGTDYVFTTARGLDAYLYPRYAIENVASWGFSKDYGLAMPQLYADVAFNDITLRLGHCDCIMGYESVPAVANFFYTHSYSMMYEPFTLTGAIGSWKPDDTLTFYAGIHDGWNNFSDPMPMQGAWAIVNQSYPGAASTAAFIGGGIFKSEDGEQSLTVLTTTGNELSPLGLQPTDGSLVGNRTLVSTVYTNTLTDRLTYVAQSDTAWQFNSALPAGNLGQQPGLSQWYSFVQWVFWKFNDRWTGGVRLEYFRDNNGYLFYLPYRNVAQESNPGYYTGGFAGNFWDLTWGLNYRPSPRWMVRPSLRYDWFSPNAGVTARPYGRGLGQGIGTSGDRLSQFSAACDAIFQF